MEATSNNPRLIALYSSTMQSGKSEVAKRLKHTHGYSRMAFAHTIKHMARAFLFPFAESQEELDEMVDGGSKEWVIPGLDVTPRYIMQTIGTEWGRKTIHNDVWVRLALNDAMIAPCAVVDDLRFPNEYDAVRAAGGQVWRVIRPGAEAPDGKHPSEGLLDDRPFDQTIFNDGSLEDLHNEVAVALARSSK